MAARRWSGDSLSWFAMTNGKKPDHRKKSAKNRPTGETPTVLVRLQKVLADAGVGSRRECEDLIAEGRVDVDGEVVTQLGTKVDPGTQVLRVDGVPLKRKKRKYFAVHKPPGVLSTSKDQWRRARVIDLVDSRERLFTIGRLDKESSGLILVTNDGELANRLTHPRYGVTKTYQVTVAGVPKSEVIQKLRRGVVLSDGRVKPESIVVKKRLKQSAVLEIVLAEGRNREIRRMLARFDHKVLKLRRIAMGSIRLGNLPLGAHRELTRAEVTGLRMLAEGQERPKKQKRTKSTAVGKKRRATKKSAAPKSTTQTSNRRKSTTKKSKSVNSGRKQGAVIGGSAERPPRKKTARRKRKSP